MADHPDLTPEQEREVRRRLADARHAGPMPPEVADRLDRVLTGLAAEPVREQTVVRLADRRRRAAAMLLAAASVVVGAVLVGQLVTGNEASEDAATSAGAGQAGAEEDPAPEAQADGAEGALSGTAPATTTIRVRPGRFSADVARLRTTAALGSAASPAPTGGSASDARREGVPVCEPGSWGRGRYLPVRYGRSTGYLVFRPPQGDTQVADLFLCGGEQAVRSVTLATP